MAASLASYYRDIDTDCGWKDFGPTSLDGFTELQDLRVPCISITQNTLLADSCHAVPIRFHVEEDWKAWKKNAIPEIDASPGQQKPSFSLLMCPRRKFDPIFPGMKQDGLALSCIPAPTGRFLEILTGMHVPGIFLDTIYQPKSIFRKVKGTIKLQDCEVYIFCVDKSLDDISAICITYFPKSQQVFSVYLGHASDAEVTDMTTRLLKNQDYIYDPFVLISAFLEVEKNHRFLQVEKILDKIGMGVTEAWCLGFGDGWKLRDHQRGIAENFAVVGRLRTNLVIWNSVLDEVLDMCPGLPASEPRTRDGFMISPREHIKLLKASYEQVILRSENFLQIASLAFQQRQADTARRDAQIAINDAKQMKAIALLTMIFLPATAVAGFMDAPIYDWEGRGYFFWVITIPITIVVLACYLIYMILNNKDKD